MVITLKEQKYRICRDMATLTFCLNCRFPRTVYPWLTPAASHDIKGRKGETPSLCKQLKFKAPESGCSFPDGMFQKRAIHALSAPSEPTRLKIPECSIVFGTPLIPIESNPLQSLLDWAPTQKTRPFPRQFGSRHWLLATRGIESIYLFIYIYIYTYIHTYFLLCRAISADAERCARQH